MRCHEVKLKLTETGREEIESSTAKDMLEHIQNCPACAREQEAAGELRRILELAGQNDRRDMIPMAEMQKLIETRFLTDDKTSPVRANATTFPFSLGLKPMVTSGVAVVATVILLLMFVPFDYMDTIGYKVAFAGVSRELVEGDEQICDMLADVGLYEAAVDVLGCDTTCSLLVLDLKTRQEAQLVIAALTDVNSPNLMTDIIAVRAFRSGSWLDRVIDK